MALLESFARVEVQCAATWEKVTKQVPEILAQHVPEGQVGVFLAALYQLMCMQQQGITSMVTQARVPVHLRVHSWATQASMTWLLTQVILGLGSLSGLSPANTTTSIGAQTPQPAAPTEQVEYVAILPDGSTMVKTSLFPRKQVRCDGSATRPIYLGNDTDSGISCIDQSTPVKAPGGKRQPLASTPSRSPNSWLLHSSTGMSWWPCGRELHVAGSSTRHAYPALTTWSILGPSMGNGSIQLETNRESWDFQELQFCVEEHAEFTTAALT